MEEQPFRGQESTKTYTSEVGSVTIQESRADPKLHFCIKETDKCIQIGECCTYVEISINGPDVERMMLQGQLSGELRSSSGEKIIIIYWSDLVQVDDKMHYINQLKLELDNIDNIEQEEKDKITLQILRDAIDNYMKKVRKIVEKIIDIGGRLVGIASGCLELTVVHKSKESANKLTNPETLKEVEDFLNELLITDRIRQVSGNVYLSARLLITKEVDSSKVMEYCFTPDKYKSEKSEIQAAVQVMKAHTTEKQKETLALVEDRLKVATEEISQIFEQQLDAVKGQILTEIIKVVSRLQEPKASVESTGLPSSSVSEDESTRSQTSIPVEISQTSIPVEVSQASMTVEGVQTPSQAFLSLSDPAPSQASLSVSDPAPSQASLSVSDPAPSQASLSLSDPAPSQASLSVSDPAPSQASLSVSDPAPSQVSLSLSDPAPSQASLSVSDPAPSQASLSVSDPAPSQASMSMSDPAPSQASLSVSDPAPSQASMSMSDPAPSQASLSVSDPAPSQASLSVSDPAPSQASLSVSDPAPSQASLSLSDPAPSQASLSVSDPAPSQASLSVSDPAPSQASLSLSDPAPSQASLSVSDPAPSQASLSVSDPAPSQASLSVSDPAPSQASLSVRDPAPSQASMSMSDPAPSQASLSLSDPAPSQASLSVSDPAPSQASLSVSDPAPSQASMSMSDPAPSQASMSHSVRSGLRFDEPEDIDIEELALRSKARPFFSREITAPTSKTVSDDSIQHDERKELYDEEKTILIPDVKVKDRSTDSFQNIEKFLQFLLRDEEDRGEEKSDTTKSELEKVTKTGPRAYEKWETKGLLEGIFSRNETQQIKHCIKKCKSDLRNLGDKMAVDAVVIADAHTMYDPSYLREIVARRDKLSSEDEVALIVLGGEELVSKPIVGSWNDVLYIFIRRTFGRIVDIGRHYTVLPKILMDIWPRSSPRLNEITHLMTYFNLHPAIFHSEEIPSAEGIFYKHFTWEQNKTEFSNFLVVETAVGKIVSNIKEPKDDDKDHRTSLMEIMKQHAWSSLLPKGMPIEVSYLERRIVSALDTLPELGTRVRWKVPKSHEGEVRGTVVKHMYPDLLLVIFDDGAEQYFTWSFQQTYLTFSVPTKASKEQLPVGTLVQRGKDWKFGDQDGGEEEIGVVIRGDKIKYGELIRWVCWRSSAAVRKIDMYRYGDQGKYDIKPLEHLHEVDPVSLPADSDKVRQWEVLDEKGQPVIIPKKLMWSLQHFIKKPKQKTVVTSLRGQQAKITLTEKGPQIKNLEDDNEYTVTV